MTRRFGAPASAGVAVKGARHTRAPNRRRHVALAVCAVFHAACGLAIAKGTEPTPAGLARLSIEELADIEVSSVSKRPERLADAPAAVFVITRDDIRRSGAVTLPEALRLAPNLQVARASSNSWAISARGFNNTSANKLLVMIDGRTVYTPLHSGVFWDVQDVIIADVERIEVVSGPGGTLWGANAVNGVINVITRQAQQSIGTVASVGAGNEEQGLTVRHGLLLGDDAAVRGYVKTQRFEASERQDGSALSDAWNRQQAGFRADFGKSAAWTVQGDVNQGKAQGGPGFPDRLVSGGNLLARYSREFDDKSGLQVQAYFDSYRRRQPSFFDEDLDTYDVDAQHHFGLRADHEIVWGGGLREQHDRTRGGALLAFVPANSTLRLINVFGQDTWTLSPQTKLTFGLKVEHNSYTGVEYQPNVHLAWKPSEQTLVWAAISRAVRTPSRLDRDFYIFIPLGAPYTGRLLGGTNFQSERVTAYELGYRAQPAKDVSVSISAFVNDYTRLRSIEANGSGDFVLGNNIRGRTHGLEAWAGWQVTEMWRVNAGVSLLSEDLKFEPDSTDPGTTASSGNDPKSQLFLRSSWSLGDDLSLDLGLRRIGALPSPAVPAYTALDARVAWRINKVFELALSAANLGGRHVEFNSGANTAWFGRTYLLRLTCLL
ncbi:TonB-dependent receptor plug domain-containing protein [Piscinibacter terrae]|uniref:TonB-dependent receptor n=1 Tax=Piscinibacter terrae TaxID=2496871 RepID=A0A3N7HL85_9BURK|nr:TonB-dependent receptor [Albitalea terrae]RQP22857.1 TonB-dependent receptor [Albitalea terrae]